MSKPQVLVVAGPTASGKSALGMALAKQLGGEIVCMDSMQVYRHMDIGTAKPTAEERKQIPHHLVDIRQPDAAYSVAQYDADATQAIENILSRGHVPMLVGGTGFYLRALTHGLHLGGVPSDPDLREKLKAEASDEAGRKRLHDRLQVVDPVSAARLHENDVTRVSRALEVFELTGKPISTLEQPPYDSPFAFCILGTDFERAALYCRIDTRVDQMMAAGLLDEVKALLSSGIPKEAQAMQGIGYKELVPVITQSASLQGAVAQIKQNSRRYAKRQWTWFRREDSIHWLDMADPAVYDKALATIQAFVEGTNV